MRNTGMISARSSNLAASRTSKFGEKMADYILYKNLDGKYLTIKDLVKEEEAAKADSTETEDKTEDTASAEEKKDESSDANKEPEKTTIYYVTDEIQQSQYINMFREAEAWMPSS